VLNLALANKDPNAWGADAHQFRVRNAHQYAQAFVGFADFASDATVAEGKMNRNCPAKTLALQMGKAFFNEWEQGEWCTRDSPSYTEATPFVDNFVLRRGKQTGQSCSWRWFWQDSDCCVGSCGWRWSSGWMCRT